MSLCFSPRRRQTALFGSVVYWHELRPHEIGGRCRHERLVCSRMQTSTECAFFSSYFAASQLRPRRQAGQHGGTLFFFSMLMAPVHSKRSSPVPKATPGQERDKGPGEKGLGSLRSLACPGQSMTRQKEGLVRREWAPALSGGSRQAIFCGGDLNRLDLDSLKDVKRCN